MGKLDGKTAVITGASRGIGKVIAERFAAEGAAVVCAARTLHEGDHKFEGSLTSTVDGITRSGGRALAVAADVSDEASCRDLIDRAKAAFGPVDVLVNNAALAYYMPLDKIATNRWARTFAVNVHGPFMLSMMVLPDMIERNSGAIVNISSGAAIGPGRGPYAEKKIRGNVLYGSTKAALERFTQGLAQEVAAYDGISVTALSPSLVVATPGTIHHRLVTGADDPHGEPPSVMADAVLLLATLPAAKISGRVTYDQQILKEHGLIEKAVGRGVESAGSGYSQI